MKPLCKSIIFQLNISRSLFKIEEEEEEKETNSWFNLLLYVDNNTSCSLLLTSVYLLAAEELSRCVLYTRIMFKVTFLVSQTKATLPTKSLPLYEIHVQSRLPFKNSHIFAFFLGMERLIFTFPPPPQIKTLIYRTLFRPRPLPQPSHRK